MGLIIEVDPKTVSQYTRLKDKDSVEVWEGDFREIDGRLYEVVFDGWRFRFERNAYRFG